MTSGLLNDDGAESPELQKLAEKPSGDQQIKLPQKTLRHSVEQTLESYSAQLDGQMVTDLYELFLSEVEAPLLRTVLKETGNNQSKTAAMLGLNRGTLRKKLKKYDLL